MFEKLRGQGATEYLVLLAVVLIIALVSIALLGFFPGLAGDAKKTQSDSYWKSSRPFGILEHSVSGTTLTAVLQNNEPETKTLTTFGITTSGGTGATTNYTTNTTFSGGEKKTGFTVTVPSCTSGSTYDYAVLLNYSSPDLFQQKQVGTKNLIGKCQ